MRKLLSIFAAGGLVLSMVGSAHAEPIPFEGTLQVQLGTLPAIVTSGTGVSTVNASGGLGHLGAFTVGGNSLDASATLPLTDPANPTLVSLVGTFELGTAGAGGLNGPLSPISGGGGTMVINASNGVRTDGAAGTQAGVGSLGIQGLFRLCIIKGPGCPISIAIPLTIDGTRGAGIGGLITRNGFALQGIAVSIYGNPWTVGTAVITGIPTDNGGFSTSSAFGFAHGPQSNTSSTANPGGVVQLVTPTLVQTNLQTNPAIALFSVLTVHFTPEPGTLLLFGSGIAALGIMGRRSKK